MFHGGKPHEEKRAIFPLRAVPILHILSVLFCRKMHSVSRTESRNRGFWRLDFRNIPALFYVIAPSFFTEDFSCRFLARCSLIGTARSLRISITFRSRPASSCCPASARRCRAWFGRGTAFSWYPTNPAWAGGISRNRLSRHAKNGLKSFWGRTASFLRMPCGARTRRKRLAFAASPFRGWRSPLFTALPPAYPPYCRNLSLHALCAAHQRPALYGAAS